MNNQTSSESNFSLGSFAIEVILNLGFFYLVMVAGLSLMAFIAD